MADILFHPSNVKELEAPVNIEEYRREYDPDTHPDEADTTTLLYQARAGDNVFDIRATKVGGDEEAEIYGQFFREKLGEDIPEDAIWSVVQFRGKPSMHEEHFQSQEEMEERVKEVFQNAL